MAYTTINKSSLYQNNVIYTGDGSTQAITGVGFQPDFVWLKRRDTTGSNMWLDAVRGVTKRITSNGTDAEETQATGLTTFGADGFTLGGQVSYNGDTGTFASWNWKAGTAQSGATTGSGTAKTYTASVNTTSGISITKYTGNGTAGHTIPHNLGVAPKMIITKNLDSGITWIVGHDSMAWTNILFLDTTAAKSDDANAFYDTAPTSSVWTVGTGNGNNSNDVNYIAYCFSEISGYSKFGSYTGNSNADGTFIYTGFKPTFFMAKASSRAESWHIFDNKRLGYNVENAQLYADTNSAEATTDYIDILSNGIKFRYNSVGLNGSGETYIYMAFGQTAVGTNNIPATAR